MIHGSLSFYSKSTQIDSIQIARLYSFNKLLIEPINVVNIDDLLLELWWISNQWCIQSRFVRGLNMIDNFMCLYVLALVIISKIVFNEGLDLELEPIHCGRSQVDRTR